jgi:hypothetical protein
MNLQKCGDIVIKTKFTKKFCDYEKPLTFSTIRNIFMTKSISCTADIVYLNRFGEPDFLSKVFVTYMSDQEYCMFSVTKNYIYVYGAGLLQNMLVWTDDNIIGRQGHIGSHVSIGLKKQHDRCSQHTLRIKSSRKRTKAKGSIQYV